ncbi:MAG: flagellar motor switch protein FliG [Pseudomonadota bacterium]
MSSLPIESNSELTGIQRAAILVMYLEKEVARKILRRFETAELQQIGLAMASIEHVDQGMIEEVVQSFIRTLHDVSLMPSSGPQYIRSVLPDLLDEQRRDEVLQSVYRRTDVEFEAFVEKLPPKSVAALLRDEHLQTQAAALCLMGPSNAARVMQYLDEELVPDVTQRMARMRHIPGELADDICSSIRTVLGGSVDHLPLGGVESTARMLGNMKKERNERVLGAIADEDDGLAQALRRRMVVFDDLAELDDRGIQALLKQVDREELVRALKGAKANTRERFFKNLSSRAADDIREALEILGPIRRSVVDDAQTQITTLALELSNKGEIFLPLGGEAEDLV